MLLWLLLKKLLRVKQQVKNKNFVTVSLFYLKKKKMQVKWSVYHKGELHKENYQVMTNLEMQCLVFANQNLVLPANLGNQYQVQQPEKIKLKTKNKKQ
jgi:hypothetical protein